MVRAVLFDLDGTLVDTAPDLGTALNLLRGRYGQPALPLAAIREQASHGARGLIGLAFGLGEQADGYAALRQEFLAIYAEHLTERSTLFPGIDELLDAFEDQGIAWGVVTNKLTRYAEPLLDWLGLSRRAACVVCGDTCARAKPAPEPILYACRTLAAEPGQCLYVGDAERDVQAARAAGVPALVALYGYLAATDRPETWGGDGYLRRPVDLLDYPGLAP
ncbi:HAD family hydrolase [Parasulfuritortus cantonensis]|uniref:phosphoglycolate phosphatase n=1 Tax=Parasulfuritortus cantonensis TaxID=2528202 RepID=A0A4R1BAE0_9PROT|nr:HAD-IA family hydrolase [Parasulfuritortus cantonensis]TCJ13921.1 HAD family hydrolase [Parasulfuritortus cantonensis]